MTTLAIRIKTLRQQQERGLRAFARDVGVQPSYVVDIEAGHRMPGPEVLGRIAGALGVPLSQLQALDPRLPPAERDALRMAMAGDWGGLLDYLHGLEDWRLERLRKAADMLEASAREALIRRKG